MLSSRARNLLYGSLLVFSTSFSHALPIKENAYISAVLPRNSLNVSSLESATSSSSHSHFVSEGRLPIITEDSENPSLLTSIPTFAPPAARKERRDDRNEVGINVPIPTISLGIPSMREIRRYVSERFHRKLKRRPTAQNANPLPPPAIDAVQPHKAPVSDATANFVNEGRQNKDSDSADQVNNGANVDEINNGAAADDADGQKPEELTDNPRNTTQDMASPGTASGMPYHQSEVEGASTSGIPHPHSLSQSLGTISHAQYEEEDNGRRRSKRGRSKHEEEMRKREPVPEDMEALGQMAEDDDVPTIWNGKVDLDDLNWFELQELDEWLDNLAWAQKHNKKLRFSNSSSTARPEIHPKTSLAPALSSSASNDTLKSPPLKSTNVAAPPKSLAKALGLISHSAFQNRTYLGDRRDKMSRSNIGNSSARKPILIRTIEMLDLVSAQNDNLKLKREEPYDPNLEPIDISDEAYDEFRKAHPKFFGGWGEKRATARNNGQYNI